MLWDYGVTVDLGTLHGFTSYASRINNAGQIAGRSDNHAFLWQDGTMQDLGSLAAPYTYSVAYGINDLGQIAGAAYAPPGPRGRPGPAQPVIWDQGTIHTLGTLGGSRSGASAINNAGQLIGVAQTPDGIDHPVIWDGGTIHDLATVIPAASGSQLRAAGRDQQQRADRRVGDRQWLPGRLPAHADGERRSGNQRAGADGGGEGGVQACGAHVRPGVPAAGEPGAVGERAPLSRGREFATN